MSPLPAMGKKTVRHASRDVFAAVPEGKPNLYVLSPRGEPVPVFEHKRWQDWINTHDRVVARTDISDTLYVETMFYGIDHRPVGQSGPPLLFTTEIWRNGRMVEHYRLATLKRACIAHAAIEARLLAEDKAEQEVA